jgi:hypothetical protein
MEWFIEALNPYDGLAFIARREQAEPVEVFFVGAPQFHPLPVRHIATAQWAMRGTFQEGLRDITARLGKGGLQPEIVFPTLEKAIEFVRRLFNALGPLNTPMIPLPNSPTPLSPSGLKAVKPLITALTNASDRSKIASGVCAVMTSEAYQRLLRSFLIGALARMPAANATGPGPDEDRTAFLILLGKCGLWTDAAHIVKEWEVARPAVDGAPLLQKAQGTFGGAAARVHARLLSGLLLRVPAPVLMPAPYFRGLPTLGHHLAAAASDRRYMKLLNSDVLLVPFVAVGLVMASATIDLTPGSQAYFAFLADKASHWISDSIADNSLADIPGAEAVISRATLEIAKLNEAHFAGLDEEAARKHQAEEAHIQAQQTAQAQEETHREQATQAEQQAERLRRQAEAKEQEEKARAQQQRHSTHTKLMIKG